MAELVSRRALLLSGPAGRRHLAYQTDEVPVGEDQGSTSSWPERSRSASTRRYGELFTVPRHRIPEVGARILDLQDPDKKMSTHRWVRAGDGVHPRPTRSDRTEVQVGGHRLRQGDPAGARQARDLEPGRDHGRRARRARPKTSNRSTRATPATLGSRTTSVRPSPSTYGRSGRPTTRSAPTSRSSSRSCARGPPRPARSRPRRSRPRPIGWASGRARERDDVDGRVRVRARGRTAAPSRSSFRSSPGPFRVLADLILEQKIDVCDVSIATVTDGFLAHCEGRRSAGTLEEATWFLAVCAIMLELKVGRLMPRHEVARRGGSARRVARPRVRAFDRARGVPDGRARDRPARSRRRACGFTREAGPPAGVRASVPGRPGGRERGRPRADRGRGAPPAAARGSVPRDADPLHDGRGRRGGPRSHRAGSGRRRSAISSPTATSGSRSSFGSSRCSSSTARARSTSRRPRRSARSTCAGRARPRERPGRRRCDRSRRCCSSPTSP